MIHYILIIMMVAGGSKVYGATSVSQQEYNSLAACQAASAAILDHAKNWNYYVTVNTICAEDN